MVPGLSQKIASFTKITTSMTAPALLEILDALRAGVDPRTGETFTRTESCLREPVVRRALNQLIRSIAKPEPAASAEIPEKVIQSACTALRELGYSPCVTQLAKIFIGSRSIADRSLKGLLAYNKYRGCYTRQQIHNQLMEFHRQYPEVLLEFPEKHQRTVHEPWLEVDFFRTKEFDQMDEAKEAELKAAVRALGLRKQDDRIPAYMAQARLNYPRAYEPWGRDEQALLIEAMCYTNSLDRLAPLFGRTARSVERMGQRLIFESKGG